jgi:hypothetical protein
MYSYDILLLPVFKENFFSPSVLIFFPILQNLSFVVPNFLPSFVQTLWVYLPPPLPPAPSVIVKICCRCNAVLGLTSHRELSMREREMILFPRACRLCHAAQEPKLGKIFFAPRIEKPFVLHLVVRFFQKNLNSKNKICRFVSSHLTVWF